MDKHNEHIRTGILICVVLSIIFAILNWSYTHRKIPDDKLVRTISNHYIGIFYSGGQAFEVREVIINNKKYLTFFNIEKGVNVTVEPVE